MREVAGAEQVIEERRRQLGPMRRGEKNALGAFAVTVMLWVVPGLLALILGNDDPLVRRIGAIVPESIAALIGATLLFLLPVSSSERSTITWRQASLIDWGTLLLFGGGLALGTMTAATGLAEPVGRGITGLCKPRARFPLVTMLRYGLTLDTTAVILVPAMVLVLSRVFL